MDLQKRTRILRAMLAKEAAAPQVPKPALLKPPPLFSKQEGLAKPPVLTPPSQPAIDITNPKPPTLPNMRLNGFKPAFTSPMQSANPYNKN